MRFNIRTFYILPSESVSVFLLISEQTVIISLYNNDWFY